MMLSENSSPRAHIPPQPPIIRAGMWASIALPVLLLLIFFVWPVAATLARGLGTESLGGPLASSHGAFEIFTDPRTWRLLRTTLLLALGGTLGSVLLGLPCAYILYTRDFPLRRFIRSLATAPFVLPTVVVGAAFNSLLGRGGAYEFLGFSESAWAVVMAMVFFNVSVVARTVGAFWASLDPKLTEAARMLGASPLRVFFTVTLPSLRSSIVSGASLVFLFCSTAYGIVITLGGIYTLESEIWSQTNRLNFDTAAGLSLLQFVIVAFALFLSSRGSAAHAQKMKKMAPLRLRRADLPAFALTIGVVVFLILAPMLSLLVRSLRAKGEWTLAYYTGLTTAGEGFSGGVTVSEALGNSLRSSLTATVISLIIGVPLAFALSRPARKASTRRFFRVIEALAMAPLGVSAVTLGFGYLIALQAPPLRLGASAIPLAQAIVVVPMVLRALLPILRALNPRLRDVATVLGAAPSRVLLTVDVPLAARGFALALGFAFAMSLGEFGASSFLANGDNVTLPVLISRLIARPGGNNYGMALAASVVLALLTSLVMMVCEFGSGTRRKTDKLTETRPAENKPVEKEFRDGTKAKESRESRKKSVKKSGRKNAS